MTSAIRADGVTVQYGDVRALEDVSLGVEFGSVTGLIGMNGSGKSTLFKTIMGLTRPVQGTVSINGRTPTQARKEGLLGYVPQSEDVDWTFPVSVRDVVMMGRYAYQGFTRKPTSADRQVVEQALERVGLQTFGSRQIGQLSGGQKKRTFVARGLAQGANVLLLDEPFAGVDKSSESTIVQLLRELADEGHCVLISTHDLHALPHLADEALLLLQSILFQGPVADALRPENLSLAFGLDIRRAEESE